MLAEIRSAGMGMIIAISPPSRLGGCCRAHEREDGFRVVESADREMLGSSTNMSVAQKDRLAMLQPAKPFCSTTS